MSAHTKSEWLQVGRTVYALNDRGVNWFSANVQDAHTPEAELIEVAQMMCAARRMLVALEALLADPGKDSIRSAKWDEARAAIAQARGQS